MHANMGSQVARSVASHASRVARPDTRTGVLDRLGQRMMQVQNTPPQFAKLARPRVHDQHVPQAC